MTVSDLLLHAMAGGIFCAIASALLARRYGSNPTAMAVGGFPVGAVVQVALVLAATELGWWG